MFWFSIAVLFFVLWLVKKPDSYTNDTLDRNSKNYSQGYWDGYRAHQNEVAGIKAKHTVAPTPLTPVANHPQPQTNLRPSYANSTASVYHPHDPTIITEADIKSAKDLANQSAKQKAQHDLQNINMALYVASFLLVAAAALFIGTTLPASIRFAGIWFATIAFYLVGLVLHDRVPKLRPASIAFIGTGLVLLPFTGIAMTTLMHTDATISWFITSVIGLVAFMYAAIHLKNQIIAYFAIAFIVSTATSSVATIHAGLVWYFVVLIALGSLMTFIAMIKPNWVSQCFAEPIQQTNQWFVPLTLVFSLLSATSLTVQDYWVIALVSTMYYGAVAASSVVGRGMALFVTRLLASITILLMAYDGTRSWAAVGVMMSIVGIMQAVISFVFASKTAIGDNSNELWLWIGFAMQLLALVFVEGDISWASIMSYQLLSMLIISFALAFLSRRVSLSSFGTISLITLPIVWGLNVMQPAIQLHWIAMIFMFFAIIALAIRAVPNLIVKSPSLHPYLVVNFAIFLFESLSFSLNIEKSWGIVVWSISILLVYGLMFLERQSWLSIIANIMITTLVMRFITPYVELHWIALVFIILATITLAIRAIPSSVIDSPTVRLALIANFAIFLFESLYFTSIIENNWGIAIWSTAVLLAYGLMYLERQPWLSIVANALMTVMVMRFLIPDVKFQWIALMYITLATILLAIRSLTKLAIKHPSIHPMLIINTCLYIFEALAFTGDIAIGWKFAIWLVAAILLYIIVYVERQPVMILLANAIFVVSVMWFIDLIKVSDIWREMVLSWIVFGIFYIVYWLLEMNSKKEYSVFFWWPAIIIIGLISSMTLMDATLAVASGLSLAGLSFALIVEGLYSKRYAFIDAGAVIMTVGFQRVVDVSIIDVNSLVYTHWWAVVFAGLGYLYYSIGQKDKAKIRAIIALVFISLFTGMAALGAGADSADAVTYQMLFLIEHIILMTAGLIVSWKMVIIWGTVGVVLAVMKMLSGYTPALLAFLAFILIGSAIYALVRQSKGDK